MNMAETFMLIMSVEFIEKWQTLIGSALGPFLAIMISVSGFLVKGKFKKISDRKESIRRAEIAFSQTLNHILTSVIQLEDFVERVRFIIGEVEKVTDPKTYALQETNFPPIISIYFDEDLPKMKFESYYLHNKILIIEYIVRWTNSTICQFRIDFEKLLEKNERMAEKMGHEAQRKSYIQNLKGYTEMVEVFVKSLKEDQTKSIVQAKVYNLRLMKRYLITIWKYEGVFLKYFRDRKEMEEYNGSLEAVDRINDLMKNDADSLLLEIRNRSSENVGL